MVCVAMNKNEHRFFTFLQNVYQGRVGRHASILFEEQGLKAFLTSCHCRNITFIFQLKIQNTYNLPSHFNYMGLFGDYNKHK
jgi:hypothetical protein